MKNLELKNIVKSYDKHNVLNGISLNINAGEFLVLVGPSGCGKSTLLRSIAGLDMPTSGDIIIDEKNVTKTPVADRDIAMVFQNYALYPHMTVYENMAFSLKIKSKPKSEIDERIKEIASLLQINELLDRKPKELSGGQRQRVSLGRALAKRSPIILFDEPLSNLDAHLRQQMRIEIKKIHEIYKSTIVYVTHDQTEAMTMGDRIAILNKGNIIQIDTPSEIYRSPKSEFVARFIGSPEINLIEGHFSDNIFNAKNTKFSFPMGAYTDKISTIGIRPEDISIDDNGSEATIRFIENLGSTLLLYIDYQDVQIRLITGTANYKIGQKIKFTLNFKNIIFFDKSGQRIVND
ncbi:ABC transporter ATP-binding protein [Bacteriovorax sp. Seq25_V]|uniref:ABC transporter ATP-binding protein n=1 Tax=Bacteriovorax sp. Seq25_V TaxID=1201288 RepID=UPI000389E197|nr:ABC transporter ATP-binding protein [Bacteriovorax sp. Seq25_V]EQC43684.1 TOBE domain protein [Bacteriovorax sp. Seq25_V]